MDAEHTVEQQIQVEIELLRAKYPQTQDLYREACVLLFFRFGITPTANRLYQFVRKGSMSAPAEALAKFWDTLREKSRIRIEHPDIPDDLRTAAGELTATLWVKAQGSAQDGLTAFRKEAQAAIIEAKTAQTTAEADRDAAKQAEALAGASLRQAAAQIQSLEQELAVERAARSTLQEQLILSKQNANRLQTALEDARREFTAELDKLRVAAEFTNERFQATEQRSLLEIDRERTAAAKLTKEIDQLRSHASSVIERHRVETAALQTQVSQFRQQVGILEGNLQAVGDERNRTAQELDKLRRQLTEAISAAASSQTELDGWRRKAEEAEQVIAKLQVPPVRRARMGGTKQQKAITKK